MKKSREDLMFIVGARQIKDGEAVLVGTGPPLISAALSKMVHAPNMTMFIAGVVNPRIRGLTLGTSDIKLLNECACVIGYRELYELLQAGYIDVGFMGAAQIDKYGNINTTAIGDYQKPKVRLFGSGGSNDIASLAKRTIVMVPHERRRFVEKLDYLTSPGYIDGPGARTRIGLKGDGPYKVVTEMAIMGFDEETKKMKLEAIYPGVNVAEVQRNTGFELIITDQVPKIEPPTTEEMKCLKKLKERSRNFRLLEPSDAN